MNGTLAGGRLTIEGQAAYPGGRLTSYDIRPTGRGLALRYPEGLRSLLDAELRLFGDAGKQWITGTIDVRQALYTKRYDVASELLGARRVLPLPEAASLEEGAQLDLRVRAPGTVRIDNNLATLAASADLAIQGTTRAPVVTGRAEIERGRLFFQGRTYVIQRGALDFVNPQRLDPLFDIEAETRIRSYRVTLRVSGTLERVTPTLTSDPPLSSLQILALLAGQDESEVANLTQAEARANQGNLAAAGAATLAAGRLSESVGLEREAERLFGLNRFSIDPSLLRGAGTTPDRPRHRRQAAHSRSQRALLAGPARHRRADPRRRVRAHRPLLAAAHLVGPRHRQDRRRAWLGVRRPDPPVPLMLEGAFLVLALVAPQEAPLPPPSAPAEEIVRAVRVEAAPKEGLEAFVGLVPGRPLDREAVRRAVELMFATGRFEDVAVELRRQEGEDGVEVVFRPRPAPLLVAVRVEGDRVISPGSARSTARLRAGEPLWPARLERAARDIGLALARRGHLEALVEPGGGAGARAARTRSSASARVRASAWGARGSREPRTSPRCASTSWCGPAPPRSSAGRRRSRRETR